MDPATAAILAAGASVNPLGRLLDRVFGGSVDAVGDALTRFTAHRLRNIGRIVANADKKLGDAGEAAGAVHPRVAGRILDEGSWCDDDIMVEYLGGVLAAARTDDESDDRGAMFAGLISRMSSYAIRLHYVYYQTLHQVAHGWPIQLGLGSEDERLRLSLCLPFEALKPALFPGGTWQNTYFMHALVTLLREDLLNTQGSAAGAPDFLPEWARSTGPAMVAAPSLVGIEMWLFSHGKRHGQTNAIVNDTMIEAFDDVAMVSGAYLPPGEAEKINRP